MVMCDDHQREQPDKFCSWCHLVGRVLTVTKSLDNGEIPAFRAADTNLIVLESEVIKISQQKQYRRITTDKQTRQKKPT